MLNEHILYNTYGIHCHDKWVTLGCAFMRRDGFTVNKKRRAVTIGIDEHSNKRWAEVFFKATFRFTWVLTTLGVSISNEASSCWIMKDGVH